MSEVISKPSFAQVAKVQRTNVHSENPTQKSRALALKMSKLFQEISVWFQELSINLWLRDVPIPGIKCRFFYTESQHTRQFQELSARDKHQRNLQHPTEKIGHKIWSHRL